MMAILHILGVGQVCFYRWPYSFITAHIGLVIMSFSISSFRYRVDKCFLNGSGIEGGAVNFQIRYDTTNNKRHRRLSKVISEVNRI